MQGGMAGMEENRERVRGLLKEARNFSRETYTLRKKLRELEEREGVTRERWEMSLLGRMDPATEAVNRLIGSCVRERHMVAERLNALVERKELLDTLLSALPDTHHHIMTLRWAEGRTWDAISMRMYMSARQGQRLQAEAIERMALALRDMEEGAPRAAAR